MRIRTLAVVAAAVSSVLLATAAYAQAVGVAVDDNRFDPETVTVSAGATVEWTHVGSAPHTVTASDGSFDSNPNCQSFADSAAGLCMDNGETFSFTFEEPGTYAYYCRLHGTADGGGMAGTVVVEAAEEPAPEEPAPEEPAPDEPAPDEEPPADDGTDDGTDDASGGGDAGGAADDGAGEPAADTGATDDAAQADAGAGSDAGTLPETGGPALLLVALAVTALLAGTAALRHRRGSA